MTAGPSQDTMTEAEATQLARARIEATLDRAERMLTEATDHHDKSVALTREAYFFWWLAGASVVIGFISGWVGGYMNGHLMSLMQCAQ